MHAFKALKTTDVGTTAHNGSLTLTAVARTTEGTAAMSTMVQEALGTQWQLEAAEGSTGQQHSTAALRANSYLANPAPTDHLSPPSPAVFAGHM
jgi:hypothetical protein